MRAVASTPLSCLLLGLVSASCGASTSGAAATPSSVTTAPVSPNPGAQPTEPPPQPPPPQPRSTLVDDLARAGVGNVFVFVPAGTPLFATASADGSAWATTTRRAAFRVAAQPEHGFVRVALFPSSQAALTTGICSHPGGVSTSLPISLSLHVALSALETVVHDPLDYRAPNGDRLRATPGTPFVSSAGASLLVDEALTFSLNATAAPALSLGDSLTCEGSRCVREDEPSDSFPGCFLSTTLSSLPLGFGRATFNGGVTRAEASTRAVLRSSCLRADFRDAPALARWTCGGQSEPSGSAEQGGMIGAAVGAPAGPGGLGGLGAESTRTATAPPGLGPRLVALPPDDITGALTPEQVLRVVRRNLNPIRHCYAEALASDASARGRVLVEFTVAPDGWVASARIVQRTLSTVSVETCITATVRGWAFPAPADGTHAVVRQPFDLRAPGQPARPLARIAAGTALTTPAGAPLGSVHTTTTLELDPDASTEATACFRVPLVDAASDTPTLACFAR